MSLFYSFESRLVLWGRLMTTTALRIGAGRSLEPTGTDLPVLRDALGRPFVPGSSFKGVLRSRVEALLRSLAPTDQVRRWACNPLEDSERCITPQQIADEKPRLRRQKDADQKLTDWVNKRTCLACQLFGSPWLASHVQVRDWLVDETFWLGQFQERDGVAIDRDTETASEKKLYSYEVVPVGAVFEGVIIVENAEAWQLGLLMAGLNEFERGSLALGGATSRGLGGVTLEWQWAQSRFIESRDLLDYLANPQAGQSPEGLQDQWKSAMLTKLRSMRNGSAEKEGA
jgi:CRISPR-associated RAMP protein (TIGR02581 family)